MNEVTTAAAPRRPQKRRRRWLPYLAIIVLLGLIVAGFLPKPVLVESAAVQSGPMRTTVDEEGRTRIRHRYTISAPVAGQLRRIPYKAGAVISSTQEIVAVIDPISPALLDARTRSLAEARRDMSAAQLERAREAHNFAVTELQRNRQLHQQRLISAQDMDTVIWRETSASRELATAESALRQAQAELAEFTNDTNVARVPIELRSPVTGRVLHVLEESSRVVLAGTPLVEVGDPTDLEVIIEALSRDGAAIQVGTPVELEQWGGGEPLQARVRLVEPSAFTKVSALGVEEQRVYVVADLLTPPERRGNLGDNFRVEARIITWQSDRVLKVPSGALFRQGDRWNVYTVVNGRARMREVKVGRTNATEAEVLEALKEGEEVILYPGDRIRVGQRVKQVKI